MDIKTQILGHTAHMTIAGRFDFLARDAFMDAFAPLLDDPAVRGIEVEMSGVDYMDSTALGMLLLLRDRAASRPIALVNISDVVSYLLKMTNFSRLFNISSAA